MKRYKEWVVWFESATEFEYWIMSDLDELQEEILVDYIPNSEEKKLIELILSSPSFKMSELLRDFIYRREWWKALLELFKIIWRLISEKNEIWFDEFKGLNIESLILDEKTEIQLRALIKLFEKIINDTKDIKRNLKFTYVLSAIKNKFFEKKYSIDNKEDLLKKNLQVGDIILLNKKVDSKDIWTRLLEAYSGDYDTNFWHVAIVISANPLVIRHSTAFTWWNTKDWYVEETLFNDYLKRCGCIGYDLLSLRPPEKIKDKIMLFSKKNLWKDYDRNAAIWWWLYWRDGYWSRAIDGFKKNLEEKDDCYNCVEIIAQALDQDKLKDITHPNEFLEYMDIFTPVYMTTIFC